MPITVKPERTQVMKNVFLATAAAIAFAAPAVAQSQFEAALGVAPGAFTTAELFQLDRAYEENDQSRINFILSGGSNLDEAEIERRGVELAIERAIEEGDNALANNLEAARGGVASGSTASTRGGDTVPAWLANVADDLGVDAGDFTRGELIALARHAEEGNTVEVNGLISRVTN
jgi:hypothetical protein